MTFLRITRSVKAVPLCFSGRNRNCWKLVSYTWSNFCSSFEWDLCRLPSAERYTFNKSLCSTRLWAVLRKKPNIAVNRFVVFSLLRPLPVSSTFDLSNFSVYNPERRMSTGAPVQTYWFFWVRNGSQLATLVPIAMIPFDQSIARTRKQSVTTFLITE